MLIEETKFERRFPRTAEIRVDSSNGAPKIIGYAAVFDVWTDIGGLFKERVKQGAFAKTIKESDIRALMNHDENRVLGRNKANTLSLHEDKKGLAVEIDPVQSQWADDLMKSMRRGDIDQMSFGFLVNKHELDYERDERTLVDVTLFDVSVVTYPAYPTTTAEVRSLFQKRDIALEKNNDEPLFNEDKWKELDEIVTKIKRGETLSVEELRIAAKYFPGVSAPPEKALGEEPVPPEKAHRTESLPLEKHTESEKEIPLHGTYWQQRYSSIM